MDWANERYVRVYIRDSGDWLMWPWQTRALLVFIFRKLDRSGVLHLGKGRLRALSAVVGMPEEEVATALEPLLEDGCVRLTEDRLIVPNFMKAQETPQSDKLRKQASREKAREDAITSIGPLVSRAVTPSHTGSRLVTLSQTEPSQTEPCCAGPDAAASEEVPEAPRISERRLKSVPPPPLPPVSDPDERDAVVNALRAQPKLADLDVGDLASFAVTRMVAKGTRLAWVLQAIEEAAEKSQRGEQSHVRHARVIGFIKHAKGPPSEGGRSETTPSHRDFTFDPGEMRPARRAVPVRPKPADNDAPVTAAIKAAFSASFRGIGAGLVAPMTEAQLRDKAQADQRRLAEMTAEQERKVGGT